MILSSTIVSLLTIKTPSVPTGSMQAWNAIPTWRDLYNGLRVMTEYETMSFEQLQSAVINFCDLAYEQVEALKDIIAEKKAVKAA